MDNDTELFFPFRDVDDGELVNMLGVGQTKLKEK